MKLILLFILLFTQDILCQNELEFKYSEDTVANIDNLLDIARYQKEIVEVQLMNNSLTIEINGVLDFIVEQVIITYVQYAKFKTEIKNLALDVEVSTKIRLEEIVQDALGTIDEKTDDGLKDETKECIKKNREKLQNLPNQHLTNLNKCTKEKIAKIDQIESAIFEQLRRLRNILQDLLKRDKPTEDYVKSVILEVFDVMFEIFFEAMRAALVFPRTKEDITHCGISQIDDITMEASELAKECFKNSSSKHGISFFLLGLLCIFTFLS